jgi:hypothetical protein
MFRHIINIFAKNGDAKKYFNAKTYPRRLHLVHGTYWERKVSFSVFLNKPSLKSGYIITNTSLLYNGYGVFPGGKKRAGGWPWPLTPFKCRVQESVELYPYSPYGPYGLYRASVPVQGCALPILLPYNKYIFRGHAVAQLVEARRYKPDGRGFNSRWYHWIFSLT